MDLSYRKLQILNAIITEYISSSEPIASRTIAKRYELGISPATIRNEMSDLEELGLIIQPHTSSGRIPSDSGYRIYVNEILRVKSSESGVDENLVSQVIDKNLNQIDFLMKETAKLVSGLSNYTSIVTEPASTSLVIQNLQLVPVSKSSIQLVIVLENEIVKNRIIRLENGSYDVSELQLVVDLLLETFVGKTLLEVSREEIDEVIKKLDGKVSILIEVLNVLANEFANGRDYKVYTHGAENLFSYPEFYDVDKAIGVMKTLEQKELLLTMLGEEYEDNVQILIGSENSIEQLQQMSLIKSKFKVGKSQGCIGVIGPTRMEYNSVIDIVDTVSKTLERILEKSED